MNRGDIYIAEPPDGLRPVVLITRDRAIPLMSNVTVASVTTRVRGLPTEVGLGEQHGLATASCVNCDNLYTLPKASLLRRVGSLGAPELRRLDDAMRVALGID